MALNAAPSWQQNLRTAVRRDPKKAYILGVLVLILLVAGGRAVLGSKGKTPSANAAAGKAGKTTKETQLRLPTPKKDSSPAMRLWLATPYKWLDRNLFAARIDYYPTFSGRKSRGGQFPAKDLTPEEKSAVASADEKKERQTLSDALQVEARQLVLTSTVTGAEPKALINGRMVREGDVVASGAGESLNGDPGAGFRVLRIEARRVIIEREGIKLEILMK